MAEAGRKDKRWKTAVANARAIHGALNECLKLSDQITDAEIKREAMRFVNAMEYLAVSLLGERRRVSRPLPAETELINRLREEINHILELLGEIGRVAEDLNDSEAKQLLYKSIIISQEFLTVIDQKRT